MAFKKHRFVIAVCVAAIAAVAAVMYIFRSSLFPGGENKEDPSALIPEEPDASQNKDQPADQEHSVRVALNSYEVWRADDLGFVFVTADLHIENEAEENLLPAHFHTSEGIFLSRIDEYVRQIEEHSYDLNKAGVSEMPDLSAASSDAVFLIPVKDRSLSYVEIYCDLSSEEGIRIDLSDHVQDISLIAIETPAPEETAVPEKEETVVETAKAEITVYQALDITDEMFFMISPDGSRMQYSIPSSDRVYAIEIGVNVLSDDSVVISSALFVPEGYQEGYAAMDASLRSMKETNIIGRTIPQEERGFLFFEVYGPEYSPVSYRGTLYLSLEGEEEMLSAAVDLK